MPMLASDLLNPAFVGARNPDELLAVEFHWGEVKDMRGRPALDKEGKVKRLPYVRISVPGNDTSMVNTPVREDHKLRFKRQWEFWQAQEIEGAIAPEAGWALEDWAELNEEQRRDLKYLRFTIVEQLAQASDSTLQRIGADGNGLRIKARAALKRRGEELHRQEIVAREKEISDLKAMMEGMQEQVARLTEMQTAKSDEDEAPRRGRPPKAKEEAA